jgi:hypothetical protein
MRMVVTIFYYEGGISHSRQVEDKPPTLVECLGDTPNPPP